MQRHDFAYDLPAELIAQTPLTERSASRLLVLGTDDSLKRGQPPSAGSPGPSTSHAPAASTSGSPGPSTLDAPAASAILRDCAMRDFPSLLRPNDLLVFNDTKVVAARLLGTKPSGGRVEIFLERVTAEAENEALVQLRASKPIREGLEVIMAGGTARIIGRQEDLWRVGFPGPALEFFEKWGDVPLPPYIHRTPDENDRERYQSIFARERGAVAAPTASLHFDSEFIRSIDAMGVGRTFVTLHVGAGTFQPLRTDDLDAHVMHAERVSVSAAACSAIENTRAAGGRVIAIGTTVIRALESAALAASESPMGRQQVAVASSRALGPAGPTPATRTDKLDDMTLEGAHADSRAGGVEDQPSTYRGAARVAAASRDFCLPPEGWSGDTRLFIRPGFQFRVADGLLTNFHLPESTLLMLVCAFAGVTPVLQAYEHAVREKYRFFSYGDAMFLTRKTG